MVRSLRSARSAAVAGRSTGRRSTCACSSRSCTVSLTGVSTVREYTRTPPVLTARLPTCSSSRTTGITPSVSPVARTRAVASLPSDSPSVVRSRSSVVLVAAAAVLGVDSASSLQPSERQDSTRSSMSTAPAFCSASRTSSRRVSSSTSTFTTAAPRRTASA